MNKTLGFSRFVKQICFIGLRKRHDVGEAITSVRSIYKPKTEKTSGYAYFLLAVPISTFGLGVWQVQRKKWKEELLEDLATRTSLPPVEFPEDLDELKKMEFHPIRVVGKFDHSKEMYLGPRSLIIDGDSASSGGSIISSNQTGVHVVTPFTLKDKNLTILVNRGWIPDKWKKDPKTKSQRQTEEEVELIGIVRHTEMRQPLGARNNPSKGFWLYRDLEAMAAATGSEPICLDATASSTVPGGPIGGQTRVTLRNEHLSYIMTWFSLSGATAFMWYKRFIPRKVVP